VALARFVDSERLDGMRVVELGCGLGLPSLVAASRGASVLATDYEPESLELLERNAAGNGVPVETMLVDWTSPDALVARAPFDLVLAADVLYDDAAVEPLLELLPRLGGEVWIADPGRDPAQRFVDAASATQTNVHFLRL
jgi:predicted nicotinamide N-methyase